MNTIFYISKLIIKDKLKVLTDTERSRLKKFKKQYPFSKDIDFKNVAEKISDYATINKTQAWEAIVRKSKRELIESPAIPIQKWYKYAVAASIVLFLSISYMYFEYETSVTKTAVAVSPIHKGRDKAILTLEDGSSIALEKGKNYKNKSVYSNGEQIVYNSKYDGKTSEIAFNYLTIPRGGQFFIELADKTKVWLNSESQLKFPVSFVDGKSRNVELVYGEAYFEVSPSTAHKGSKFEVLTKKQIVEVVGTQFNIKAYKDETNIYTTLVEGKVAVTISDYKQILKPNQQSNLDLKNNNIIIVSVDVENSTSWKNGFFNFKGMPLKDIMKVLSRWYDVDVEFADKKLENVKFNGVLSKDQDLKEILRTIQSTKFINAFEIENRKILIK